MTRFSCDESQDEAPALAEEGKVYTDQNFIRHTEPAERWRNEYTQNVAVESKLAEVSKFIYTPIDYTTLLVIVQWQERPLPKLDYLIEEAVIAMQNKFFLPLMLQGSGFLVLSVGAMLGGDLILTMVTATGALGFLVWLYFTAQDRQRAVEKTLAETRMLIEARLEHARKMQDAERAQHEANEIERVEKTERLLAGEVYAVLAKIDEVLSQMKLPLIINVDVDLYNQIPLVKIWLPPKTIIPNQICEILSTGRLEYEEKEERTINKQYVELCASLLVQVMSVIYAHVAVFDIAYVWGMTKYGMIEDECLLAAKMNRQSLIAACERVNGVAALQSISVQLESDTQLNLLAVQPELPSEWENVSKYQIHTMHIRIENISALR